MSEAVGCWICYWKEDTDEAHCINTPHQYQNRYITVSLILPYGLGSITYQISAEGEAHRHYTNASILDVGAIHEPPPSIVVIQHFKCINVTEVHDRMIGGVVTYTNFTTSIMQSIIMKVFIKTATMGTRQANTLI